MVRNVDSLNFITNNKYMPCNSKNNEKGSIEFFATDSSHINEDLINLSNKRDINSNEQNANKKKWIVGISLAVGVLAVGIAGYYLTKSRLKLPMKTVNLGVSGKTVNIAPKTLLNSDLKLGGAVSKIDDEVLKSAKSTSVKHLPKSVFFRYEGAMVQLTERTALDSAVDVNVLKTLSGYVDDKGEILPYLFVDGIRVQEKGKGTGKKAMDKIIQLAKEKYGGRLLLKPENRDCNPSIFYHKCGLLSTTEKGAKEISDFIKFGKPFESGYSDAMYLPILKS